MIFYINHFLLMMFYHSVWLGFELFKSLGPGTWSLGAVLHSWAKDMTITIFHNKPPDRKCDWIVDDVMPRSDSPDNLRILKRRQLNFDR